MSSMERDLRPNGLVPITIWANRHKDQRSADSLPHSRGDAAAALLHPIVRGASAESAKRLRSTAAEASGYTIQSVATYEGGLQLGKE